MNGAEGAGSRRYDPPPATRSRAGDPASPAAAAASDPPAARLSGESGPPQELPGSTRRLGRHRIAASVAFAVQGLGFAALLTNLPQISSRWSLDELAVSLVMLVVALLAGVGSTTAGAIARRRGSAAVLRVGLAAAALGLGLTAVAPTFVAFCAGLACYGIALGLIDAGTNMQAVALEAAYGRSVLASFHASWSVGSIAGALWASAVAAAGGALVGSLGPVVVLASAATLVPFLPFLPSRARRTVPGPGRAPEMPAPSAGPTAAGASAAPVGRDLLLLGAALVLFYLADSAASSWSTLYLRDELATTASVAPLAFAAYQGAGLVARLVGDLFVRRFGAPAAVRAAAVAGVVGLLLVVSAPAPEPAVTGFAVLGAGIALVTPLTFAATARLAGPGPGRRARVDALIARLTLFNYLGFVLGGVLTGLVGSGAGLRWGFVVPLVGVALLIPLAGRFRPAASAEQSRPRW